MHKGIGHLIIAAIGGIFFIIIAIARQRERKRLLRNGKKPESAMIRNALFITGFCLLIFAVGVLIYQMNH